MIDPVPGHCILVISFSVHDQSFEFMEYILRTRK